MANINVFKNDGTTSVTYTALTPSAGDKVAAQWRQNAASTVAAFRPQLALKAERTTSGSARRVRDTYVYPVVKVVNGVDTVIGKISFESTGLIPENVDDADVAEAVSQYANLRASVLIKDSYKAGFAPT
jgi:hypothetical protein